MRHYEQYSTCSLILTQRPMASKKSVKASKENKPVAVLTAEQRLLEQHIKQLERQLEDAQLLGEMSDSRNKCGINSAEILLLCLQHPPLYTWHQHAPFANAQSSAKGDNWCGAQKIEAESAT
jgi:hypothetical protein